MTIWIANYISNKKPGKYIFSNCEVFYLIISLSPLHLMGKGTKELPHNTNAFTDLLYNKNNAFPDVP